VEVFLPDRRSARPGLATAVYEQLRDAVDRGTLRPGDRVEPSRSMAQRLAVSRHTVTTAYARLVAEGYLEGIAGGGTRVATRALAPRPRRTTTNCPTAAPPVATLDLGLGQPDPSLFPLDDWRRHSTRVLRNVGFGDRSDTGAGLAEARRATAAWIGRARGVDATADDVVITSGALHALDLVLATQTRRGDTVVLEDPGHHRFRRLAELRGMRVVPVAVDDSGLIVDRLPARADLVVVTPSHQFPMGGALPRERRLALLAWARRCGALVVEDDYDSDYRYAGRPLEPLQRLDPEQVVYLGTFSKSMAPTLRAGFVVAPPAIVDALATARRLTGSTPDVVTQLTIASMLDDGTFARHLHRATRAYAVRHARVVEWCAANAESIGTLVPSFAGLHVTVRLHDRALEAAIAATALERGVRIETLREHRIESDVTGVCVGFGLLGGAALDDALHRLLPWPSRRSRRSRR
jgi:GntR family transcriptional regulator/MocR family aminotransferase